MKLTDKSRELLESKIYETLMSNPENGLGEMGACRDEAKRIVDEWIEELSAQPTKTYKVVYYWGGPYKGAPEGRNVVLVDAVDEHDAQIKTNKVHKPEFIESVTEHIL